MNLVIWMKRHAGHATYLATRAMAKEEGEGWRWACNTKRESRLAAASAKRVQAVQEAYSL
jgi:hypothetical protein